MTAIPTIDVDIYDGEAITNPLGVYKQVRDAGPVVWLSKYDQFAVGRYKDVKAILRKNDLFVSSKGVAANPLTNERMVGTTLAMDEPEHAAARTLIGAPLLPGALEEHRGRIEEAAHGLIDDLLQRDSFDGVMDFAQFLPLTIVSRLVGLPEEGRQNLLAWAAAAFDGLGPLNARSEQALPQMIEMRQYVTDHVVPGKVPEGGWAHRLFELAADGTTDLNTAKGLIRDYISPSLDTTISATGKLLYQLATSPGVWDQLRRDPSLIPSAVDEAVRMASPVSSFTRYAAEATQIDGCAIPEGARIAVMFGAANYDERHWNDPETFDMTRNRAQHVGFGHGHHMCAGMHLARLEMESLLRAMIPRVEKIEVGTPTLVENNVIRAFATLPASFTEGVCPFDHSESTHQAEANQGWLSVKIVARKEVATEVVALEFASDTPLPPFTAGAHIDVQITPGLVRQYSLYNDPKDATTYKIAVLRAPQSRGGSDFLHDHLTEGRDLLISPPRNHFELDDTAQHSVLIAGGIGVTPILCMAQHLDHLGASYELHYAGRSAERMALRDELAALTGAVHCYSDDESLGSAFAAEAVFSQPGRDVHAYFCGPTGFMDHIEKTASGLGWAARNLHSERFSAEIDLNGDPFTVVAKASGLDVVVRPGETIAQKLGEAGIHIDLSCESGVCGTCLTPVIEGLPDHRDTVQTDQQKGENVRIAVCCSRSKTKKLVLDI